MKNCTIIVISNSWHTCKTCYGSLVTDVPAQSRDLTSRDHQIKASPLPLIKSSFYRPVARNRDPPIDMATKSFVVLTVFVLAGLYLFFCQADALTNTARLVQLVPSHIKPTPLKDDSEPSLALGHIRKRATTAGGQTDVGSTVGPTFAVLNSGTSATAEGNATGSPRDAGNASELTLDAGAVESGASGASDSAGADSLPTSPFSNSEFVENTDLTSTETTQEQSTFSYVPPLSTAETTAETSEAQPTSSQQDNQPATSSEQPQETQNTSQAPSETSDTQETSSTDSQLTTSKSLAGSSAVTTTFSSVANGKTIIVTQTSIVTTSSQPTAASEKSTSGGSGGLSATNKIVVGVVVGVGGAILLAIAVVVYWMRKRGNKFNESGWTFWRKNEKGGDDFFNGELGVRDRNINQGSNF